MVLSLSISSATRMQRIKIQWWRWYSNRERLVSNLSHCNLKSRKLENPNWELRAVISWVKIKTPTRLPKIHLSEWSAIILIQCPNNNLTIRSRLETRAKLINLGKWWKIPIKMSHRQQIPRFFKQVRSQLQQEFEEEPAAWKDIITIQQQFADDEMAGKCPQLGLHSRLCSTIKDECG